jgi:uncharacterized iron-regulated membrane protein
VIPAGPRLSPMELLARLKSARPEVSPQSIAFDADPTIAASVGLAGSGTIYVSPYSGAVQGAPSPALNAFFQSMTSWHRYLGASGESRDMGRAATGASNLAFLVLGLSGLYLWWPKRLTVRYLRPIVWFRRASTSRARDFNWHNTIGFWCLLPIVIMTASGVVMSYAWGNNLVYRLTGSPIPQRGGPAGPAAGRPAGALVPSTLDQLFAKAAAQVPTWSQLSLRLPNREGAPTQFTITDGAQWNRFARSQLTLNSASGEVVQWQPYEAQSLGQKVRGWLRFAHTGELGGLAGQVVAGLGCVGGVFLVYTGFALAFRRLVNWSLWARLGLAGGRRVRECDVEDAVA